VTWVDAGTAGFLNLDQVMEAYVLPVGGLYTINVRFTGDAPTPRTLPGTYTSQADAQARIRELFNAVPLADIT
jgi:hypothetical protein